MTAPILYEPDEQCPRRLLWGVGLQGVMLNVATVAVIVTVTVQAGGGDDAYLSWAMFAALVLAGALTALQASHIRRFAAGHILLMGPTLMFLGISVIALETGGPALLGILTVAAALSSLAMARWLPLLRRIITPAVAGTALMLIAVSVLPIGLERVQRIPADAPQGTGPIAAVVTLLTMTLLSLRASRRWRPWSPLVGVLAGWVVAAGLGAWNIEPVHDARWLGIPADGLPRFELAVGWDFLALLPAFLLVSLVGGVKVVGDGVAVQQASRRNPRATDFRQVQGSLNTNAIGILLSGLAATPLTTPYAASSVRLVTMTAVATRQVGYVIGGVYALLALSPKVVALLVSIPGPVAGAFLLTAMGRLFVSGISTVVKDGLDAQKVAVVATSFGVGAALEHTPIFGDVLGDAWSPLLDSGLVVGTAFAVLLTLFLEVTTPVRHQRLDVVLSVASLPAIDEFLRKIAARMRWNDASTQRLRSAGEETLLSLVEPGAAESAGDAPEATDRERATRLIVIARPGEAAVEIEFVAVFDEQNLEDRLAYLSEEVEGTEGSDEGEISLRLLRHYASSVHHQKYFGLDIVTVQIRGSR